MIALPSWVNVEAWDAFLAMRKTIKKPLTDYAQKLALRKLYELRAAGQDANAVLDQSIFHCWEGLFPVRPLASTTRRADAATTQFARMTGGLSLVPDSRVPVGEAWVLDGDLQPVAVLKGLPQ